MIAVNPFDLVIFGGTGDLATRKLLPALYYRHCAGQLPAGGRILALGRKDISRDEYLNSIMNKSRGLISEGYFDEAHWAEFAERIDYLRVEVSSGEDFTRLYAYLQDQQERVRIYYLSTSPELFAGICQNLKTAELVTPQSRVVLEKPLGHDLPTSDKINSCVEAVFAEDQIFRIDHYLGKEAVQNLMALRFGNSIFEPLWKQGKIRDVQITLAEQIGVEGRGEFYDSTGSLRDMLQNHLMQLLCIVAMEPPINMDANNVRDEKLKVLRSLQPFTPQSVAKYTVRGQYSEGTVEGNAVPGYLEEPGVAANSSTETYVAVKAKINNWRWAGVPFYLRTGKRLQQHVSEVVINFYSLPHSIFPVKAGVSGVNRLYIRVQPQEKIELHLMAKQAGDKNILKPVKLNLDLADNNERHLEAYERLLMDVIRGNQTLFVRRDESDAAWQWVEPILKEWEATADETLFPYAAGSAGPEAANELIRKSGTRWFEDV